MLAQKGEQASTERRVTSKLQASTERRVTLQVASEHRKAREQRYKLQASIKKAREKHYGKDMECWCAQEIHADLFFIEWLPAKK